jgi:Flp pilus assembly protein TadG
MRGRAVWAGERGSSSVSAALITPSLVLFIGLVLVAGRIALAGNAVGSAASAAARDASLARDAGTATAAAQAAAIRDLDQQGIRCASTSVVVDPAGLGVALGQPARVEVTVSCVVQLSDIGVPGLPGSKTLTSTATSPVDQYRQR